MANTYVAIAKNVLTSSTLSVTFSSIPATYTDLLLVASARIDGAGVESAQAIFNGDTSAIYSYVRMSGTGATPAVATTTGLGYSFIGYFDSASETADTFTSFDIYIPNYLSTSNKQISITAAEENNAATAYISTVASLYRNTSAISSIQLKSLSGSNLVSGSRFDLYGIKSS